MTESPGAIPIHARSHRLAQLLAKADRTLTAYRVEADRLGLPRLAMTDLCVYEDLRGLADDGVLTVSVEEAMVRLIEGHAQPELDPGGYAYEGLADDLRDVLERLGLLKEE